MGTLTNRFLAKATVRLAAPAISVSPASLTFEYQDPATSAADQTLVLTNSGENPSTLYWSLEIVAGAEMALTAGPFNGTLEAGESQNITVSVPAGLSAGEYVGTIEISDATTGTTVAGVDVVVTLVSAVVYTGTHLITHNTTRRAYVDIRTTITDPAWPSSSVDFTYADLQHTMTRYVADGIGFTAPFWKDMAGGVPVIGNAVVPAIGPYTSSAGARRLRWVGPTTYLVDVPATLLADGSLVASGSYTFTSASIHAGEGNYYHYVDVVEMSVVKTP